MMNQAGCIFLGGDNQFMFTFQFSESFLDLLYVPMTEMMMVVE